MIKEIKERITALENTSPIQYPDYDERGRETPQFLAKQGWKFLSQHPELRDSSTRKKHEAGIKLLKKYLLADLRGQRQPLPSWYLKHNSPPPDYDVASGTWEGDSDEDEDDLDDDDIDDLDD